MGTFKREALDFLAELEQNNNKVWFDANKERYEHLLREPALAFIEEMDDWFTSQGLPYRGKAKKVGGSLSRIYRDVRFSADKSPYHSHVILHFDHSDATKESPRAVLGLRFDAHGVGFGGGVWTAPTPILNQIRDHIVAHPEDWNSVARKVTLDGERLKTAPRGYDANHPMVEALRLKNFLGHIDMKTSDLTGNLIAKVQASCKPLLDYNAFLNEALAQETSS